MTFRILAMGGDGIGTEVLDQGIRLIDILSTTYGVSIDITEDFSGEPPMTVSGHSAVRKPLSGPNSRMPFWWEP